jgi:predicted DNA-binding protein (MmcQ/YjbR family)
MTPAELRELCLAQMQATETFPFGEETSVFKASGNGKIFALSHLAGEPLEISLKVDPEDSIALRAEFPAIRPGYHLNKKHWVTIVADGVDDELIEQLVHESHTLVAPKVRARKQP